MSVQLDRAVVVRLLLKKGHTNMNANTATQNKKQPKCSDKQASETIIQKRRALLTDSLEFEQLCHHAEMAGDSILSYRQDLEHSALQVDNLLSDARARNVMKKANESILKIYLGIAELAIARKAGLCKERLDGLFDSLVSKFDRSDVARYKVYELLGDMEKPIDGKKSVLSEAITKYLRLYKRATDAFYGAVEYFKCM